MQSADAMLGAWFGAKHEAPTGELDEQHTKGMDQRIALQGSSECASGFSTSVTKG
jgi:hypothetical protein